MVEKRVATHHELQDRRVIQGFSDRVILDR